MKKEKENIFIVGVWIGVMFVTIFSVEELSFWHQLLGFLAFAILPLRLGYNLKSKE